MKVEDTFKGEKGRKLNSFITINVMKKLFFAKTLVCSITELHCKHSADFKTKLDSTFTAVNYKSLLEY